MSFCSVFFWCQPFWKMRFTWMHDDRCSSTRLQRVVKCSMFWKRRHDWIVWFNYGFKVCLDMFGVSITWKLHSEYQLWGCDLLLQDMQTAKQFCYLRYPQALQIHWRIRCTYFTWRDITRYACNMFRCSFLQHTLASDRMEPFFARWKMVDNNLKYINAIFPLTQNQPRSVCSTMANHRFRIRWHMWREWAPVTWGVLQRFWDPTIALWTRPWNGKGGPFPGDIHSFWKMSVPDERNTISQSYLIKHVFNPTYM